MTTTTKRKGRWIAVALVACLVAALCGLAGCGSSSSSADKDTLKIGELWAIDSIDPVSNGTLMKEKAMVTEVLCEVDDQFQLQPGLATEWHNTDDTTWVFTLRPGVKFQDGTDMTADAVAWSINNSLAKNPTFQTQTNISSVEATGDNQITIKTSVLNAEIPEYMHLSGFGIIAQSSYDADGNLTKPIGTGPYQVDNFDVSTGVLTTTVNDNYYGEKPSVKKVVITGMPDANTRAAALESGEVDFTCDLPFNKISDLDGLSNVRVEKYDTARVYCAYFNCASPLFSDKNVRKATSLAIDRNSISNNVLYGCGSPSKEMHTSNMAWCDNSIDGSTFDLEQAKQLMDAAGWVDTDGDGYREKNGQMAEFTLLTYTQRPGLPLIAEALQAQLKELGIKVDVSTMDSSAIREYIDDGKEYGMSLAGNATCMTPSCLYFLNNNYSTKNSQRYGYSNAEFDTLLAQGLSEFDTQSRYETSKQIQRLAMDELNMVYICNYGVTYGFNERVTNFKFNPTAHDYMWNVDIKVQ